MVFSVAWGVLAFGAVYPWAYWPLLVAATVAGVLGLRDGRKPKERGERWLSVMVVAIGAAIAIQLVPLPARVLTSLSPGADRLLRTYDLSYSAIGGLHPLSIDPDRTRLALLCFSAFAIFCLGAARRLNTARVMMLARVVTILGVIVAVHGVIQKSSGTMLIYGFWQPLQHPYQIFGPFVNKNHYAGWMIMAVSLTIGSIGSAVAASARRMPTGWRDRLLWLSTPDANYILLALVGAPIMIAALLMTLSRSGIVSFGVVVAIATMCLAVRARRKSTAMVLTAAYATIALIVISGWSRLDAVSERFGAGSNISLEGRLQTWRDAARIARDFPVAGTGVNTFDTAMLFYQSQRGAHWDAAHNDYVQLLADGGLLLTIPIVIAVLVFVRHVATRLLSDRANPPAFWLRLGAVLGLGAIAVQETVDFSLQLPGNAVMCALLVAIALHKSAEGPVDQRLTSTARRVL